MWIIRIVAGTLCLLLMCSFCVSQEDEYTETENTLRRVLDSLSSALNFMAEEYDKLNLDGVIGLRLVEGQLNVLLHQMDESGRHHLSDDIMEAINRNRQLAGSISNRSLPIIQKDQSEYYKRIGFILQEGFWEHNYPSRDLDLHHVRRPKVLGEAMREAQSDTCLEELKTDRRKRRQNSALPGNQCDVSMSCWRLMTGSGYRYYSLSHEVFYLLIGQSTGCFSRMSSIIERLSGQFCASMLVEARSVVYDGYAPDKQDIFMEDAALCGIYGYRQFFNTDWLNKMLSWQRLPRGCWGMAEDEVSKAREEYTHIRVKREERVLKDGCECHRTAVAVGALTQYIRYTIEYMESISGYDFF